VITGIVVALPEELRTLTKSRVQQGECISVADNILLTLSGAGAKNAIFAAQNLIDKGADRLISWGCAGALAPHLKAGDLLIPDTILAKNNTQFATRQAWSKQIIDLLKPGIQCHTGRLFESGSIINLAQDKVALHQQTAALAVDMESGAVARTALKADIPFVVIRSIADLAGQNLPQAIAHAMTDKGVISLPKLMLYLCSHPTELPGLIKLGLNFNAASKTLKTVASHLPEIAQVQ